MQQLFKWEGNDVIQLRLTDHSEKAIARRIKDRHKGWNRWIVYPTVSTEDHRALHNRIRKILVREKPLTKSDENDAMIVFAAIKYGMILLTYDGGILAAAPDLSREGAQVLRPVDAIKIIAAEVILRDRRELASQHPAAWVGADTP